jgi:hypothetical protein
LIGTDGAPQSLFSLRGGGSQALAQATAQFATRRDTGTADPIAHKNGRRVCWLNGQMLSIQRQLPLFVQPDCNRFSGFEKLRLIRRKQYKIVHVALIPRDVELAFDKVVDPVQIKIAAPLAEPGAQR